MMVSWTRHGDDLTASTERYFLAIAFMGIGMGPRYWAWSIKDLEYGDIVAHGRTEPFFGQNAAIEEAEAALDNLPRTLWMIDYYAAGDKSASDCYPDFLDSRAEAERIAPEFMRELDWAVHFEIRPITED